MIDFRSYWWPLAATHAIHHTRPLARTLLDTPLVLFKDEVGSIAILHDRCPHRHAPLSEGKVHRGQLACPYHGWQFNGQGHCTKIPGMETSRSIPGIVPTVATRVHDGIVWACLAPSTTPGLTQHTINTSHTPSTSHTPNTPSALSTSHTRTAAVIDDTNEPATTDSHRQPDALHATWLPGMPPLPVTTDMFWMTEHIHCTLADAAENFLDGFHTHFVHAGWVRHDSQRQQVTVEIRRIHQGIEARYSDENVQSGIISRFFEGDRTESFGRFRLPGIAEIEYRGQKGLNLIITAWLTPADTGSIYVHARIATRKGHIPAWLKSWVLQRLFRRVLKQDKHILETTQRNHERFRQMGAHTPFLNTSLDFLGPSIRLLLTGSALSSDVERTINAQI